MVIQPLSAEDGGGFLATVPDLPGRLSDGETREEAARNVEDAILRWLDQARKMGRAAPEPKSVSRDALRPRSPESQSLAYFLQRYVPSPLPSLNSTRRPPAEAPRRVAAR